MMTTPMPPDHEVEAELRQALLADAERITPDPALHRILARAHEGRQPRTVWRRRWLPVLAGGVATAGIVAAAVVIFAPSNEPTGPAEPVPCSVEVRDGCPVDLAVYFQTGAADPMLLSGSFTVTSSGDVGVDAVQTLLTKRVPNQVNPWTGLLERPEPVAQVNHVTHESGEITVDFDRELNTSSASMADPAYGRLMIQQLVHTVQSALRTDDPVLITVNGDPAAEAFGYPLSGPEGSDDDLVYAIRPESPSQGETVESPVHVTGEASVIEGTVQWSVTREGAVVDEGFVTAGGETEYLPFDLGVDLQPGEYTLKLWEENLATGREAWTRELAVVYIDFVVE